MDRLKKALSDLPRMNLEGKVDLVTPRLYAG